MTRKRNAASLAAAALAAVLLPAPLPVPARDLADVPGYVDGKPLIEMAGDDCVTLEINVSGTLIRILGSVDPELADLVSGLENIHAVILDLSECTPGGRAHRLSDFADALERRLLRAGWERVAMVREPEATTRLLLLPRGELIDGLVVTIVGADEVVFTNIAGSIDLRKLQKLGEEMDLPGLDDIDLDEIERKKKERRRRGVD